MKPDIKQPRESWPMQAVDGVTADHGRHDSLQTGEAPLLCHSRPPTTTGNFLNFPFEQTHLDRLAAVTVLFGPVFDGLCARPTALATPVQITAKLTEYKKSPIAPGLDADSGENMGNATHDR